MKKIVLFLALCSVAPAQEVRRALPVTPPPAAFDQQAKFLAGVPLAPNSPLARLQQSPAYLAHATAFEKMWARYNENYFTPMRLWSSVALSPRIQSGLPVYYFFGGPDALSAITLYPAATDFLLGGLEPVGSVSAPDSLDTARLDTALANLRNSTDVILSFGHFITKDMKADLDATDFRGVLPVMLAFVAMSGAEVLDVSYFGVASGGRVQEFGLSYPVGGVLPGVRITFRTDPLSPPKRLHYVQANVANDPLKANPAVLEWAKSFGPGNVYLKAASYLMHEAYFSTIRGFLLTQGRSVLQDDSGIPLKFFRDGQWRLWFFGTYDGTLEIFKKYHQPEAVEAFRTSAEVLPFGTGYKWRRGESNLLLAVRQDPPKAEPVTRPIP